MGQHEDVAMIRRFVAPPPLPLVIRPRPSHRPEHVAAQYPRTDIGKAALGKIVIGTFAAAVVSEQLFLERARREYPLVQGHAADTKRIVDVLSGAGPKPVSGHAETAYD
jgi:hypothetical protein